MSLSELYPLSSAQSIPADVSQDGAGQKNEPSQQLIIAVGPQLYQIDAIDTTTSTTTVTATSTTTAPALITEPPNLQVTTKTNNNDSISTKETIRTRRGGRRKRETSLEERPSTRFKWTKEMMQVAMNLLQYGCKPRIVSVAVGCSIRTAQKFAENVTPREEGQSFRQYELKRRGRKLKNVNPRLDAIREALNEDCTKTQVEIAADLNVSNTTVCRDLKKIGGAWRDKKVRPINTSNGENTGSNENTGNSIGKVG